MCVMKWPISCTLYFLSLISIKSCYGWAMPINLRAVDTDISLCYITSFNSTEIFIVNIHPLLYIILLKDKNCYGILLYNSSSFCISLNIKHICKECCRNLILHIDKPYSLFHTFPYIRSTKKSKEYVTPIPFIIKTDLKQREMTKVFRVCY